MSKELILVGYGLVFIMSILQLIAGGVIISLGNQLTDSQNNNIYSAMYSAEGGFYIATGVITLILLILLLVAMIVFTTITYLKKVGQFMLVTILLCFQGSMAVYSSINASVLGDQSDKFSTFTNSQCKFSNLRYLLVSIAVLNWLLICPILIILLNSMWSEWKETLDKQSQAQLSQPTPQDALNP